jgi:hypothetical protein
MRASVAQVAKLRAAWAHLIAMRDERRATTPNATVIGPIAG